MEAMFISSQRHNCVNRFESQSLANCNLGQLTQFFFFFSHPAITQGQAPTDASYSPIVSHLQHPSSPLPFILPFCSTEGGVQQTTFLKLTDQHSEHQLFRDFSSESVGSVNPTSSLFLQPEDFLHLLILALTLHTYFSFNHLIPVLIPQFWNIYLVFILMIGPIQNTHSQGSCESQLE